MRFHHSTRRGRNRLSQRQANNSRFPQHSNASISRWSQLGYCRETNIHFNRRLPIEPVPMSESREFEANQQQLIVSDEMTNLERRLSVRKRKQTAEEPAERLRESQIDERLRRLSLRRARADRLEGQISDKSEEAKATAHQETAKPSSNSKLDMEAVRAKLVAQVDKHPFWSSKAARKMRLTSLEERRVYIYELISYCERRELEWRYESYKGGLVGPAIGFKRSTPVADSATGTTTRASFYAPGALQTAGPSSPSTLNGTCSPTATTCGSGDSFWTGSLAASGTSPQLAQTGTESKGSPVSSNKRRASISRRVSGATSPPSGQLYEPLSAIERTMPSAELIWSIEIPVQLRPEAFTGYLHSSELANSSFVKRCHGCQGRGRLKCASCHGVGYEVCISCSGKGTTRCLSGAMGSGGRYGGQRYGCSDNYYARQSASATPDAGDPSSVSAFASLADHSSGRAGRGPGEPGGITQSGAAGSAWATDTCHNCRGAGQKRCWVCAGKSYNNCMGCLGSGQLRCYLNLNITWTNHRDESILNNNDNIIPRDRLKLCSGIQLADEIGDRLGPLRCKLVGDTTEPHPEHEANQIYLASKRWLEKHNQTYKQERLLKQRHKVTQVDCYIVSYEWKQRNGHFVIYGDERKVYIAKYPFKSICSIT